MLRTGTGWRYPELGTDSLSSLSDSCHYELFLTGKLLLVDPNFSGWTCHFWSSLCGQFFASLLPDSCLYSKRTSDHGCGFLLHGQCRGAFAGNTSLRLDLSDWWTRWVPNNRNADGGSQCASSHPVEVRIRAPGCQLMEPVSAPPFTSSLAFCGYS